MLSEYAMPRKIKYAEAGNAPRVTLLSHKLAVDTPAFALGPGMQITPLKEISKGGSSNSYSLSFSNHLGTHVDAPNHFDPKGRRISSYGPENFIFSRPILFDLPKQESQLIRIEDLEQRAETIEKADLLLLRTGFQRYRKTDPKKYATRNPGISASGAEYIARSFPRLRAIGVDTISISAVEHREEGREAHRNLLRDRDYFIIEDMDLAQYPKNVGRILALPLFVEGIDSAPCTVIAELI